MSAVIFFDRDDTLIKDIPYNADPEKIYPFEDTLEVLNKLKSDGFYLCLLTNQSGVGRGKFTLEQMNLFHKKLLSILPLDEILYCPHDPNENCECRKPKTKLIDDFFSRKPKFKRSESYLVGDKDIDMECAINAQLKRFRINYNQNLTLSNFYIRLINPIKVLHITSRADIGGGPKHVVDLVSGLNDLNIENYIASPLEKPFVNDFQQIATKWFEIPKRKFSILWLFKIIIFLRANNIKLVHSHGRGAGYYTRLLKIFGFKTIHTFHGAHNEMGFIGKIKIAIDQLLGFSIDQYISVSSGEKIKAINLNFCTINKITVIENAINVKLITKAYQGLDRMKAKMLFELPLDKIIIGGLTRYEDIKGVDLIIEFIKEINDPKFYFCFVGDGPNYQKYQSIILSSGLSHKIKLLPATDNPVMFLKTLDIFISASKMEGMPLSVLEAAACNIPLVLSDIPGHNFPKLNCINFKNRYEFFEAINNIKPKSNNMLYDSLSMAFRTSKLYQLCLS